MLFMNKNRHRNERTLLLRERSKRNELILAVGRKCLQSLAFHGLFRSLLLSLTLCDVQRLTDGASSGTKETIIRAQCFRLVRAHTRTHTILVHLV